MKEKLPTTQLSVDKHVASNNESAREKRPVVLDPLAMDIFEYETQSMISENRPAQNLKKFRKRIQRTQEEFAMELGLSRRSLQDLEAGRSKISSDILIQLYVRFGLDLHQLLTGELGTKRAKTKELFAEKAIDATFLLKSLYKHASVESIRSWAIFLAARGAPEQPVTIQDVWEEMPEEI